MTYHYGGQPDYPDGLTQIVGPPQSDLRLLSMGRLHLSAPGATFSTHTAEQELVIDVLGGTGSVELIGPAGTISVDQVGQRETPSGGPPSMLYIPRRTAVSFTCLSAPLDAVVARAPINASEAPREDFGRDNWQRVVYPCIGLNVDANGILMGETHIPSGNWASYPPHKHDENTPSEMVSEEIYHFLIDPPHGFGMQYLWTAPGDSRPIREAYPLHNGDTVAIPRGYHPTVVAPGFRMITVWAFAGERRAWGRWSAEPAFEKLLQE
jgi:5-deoxy-glucuronate isomerase